MFPAAVDVLCGRYSFEAMLFDASKGTARVTHNTLKKVAAKPDDWALAMFDYHN